MKPQKSYFIVSYDISDTKRLAKIAKRVEKYLNRVLYSVFEGELTDRQLKQLRDEVEDIIMLDEDSVIYFKLCTECAEQICTKGLKVPIQKDEDFVIV
ncbi:MAG: CRISPR-associated endonuclease Cas2 [Dissulfuribacterales bacterium]